MRALVFTASGHRNLWDELILREEVRLLRGRFGFRDIAAATYDPASLLAEGVRAVGYFPHALRSRPLVNIRAFFRTVFEIARADAVVFGGGGLIYDNEAGQSFAKLRSEWLLRVLAARLLRRKIFWCAVGVYVSSEHAGSLRPLFAGARTRVSVRDEASRRALAAIGIEAELVPDPVHLFEPAEPSDPDSRLVGIALRGGYAPGEDALAEGLAAGLRDRGFEPVFCSHSLHDADPDSNDFLRYRPVADRLGARITRSMADTLALYPRLRAMVSMRLHADILSFAHALPFVAVSYSAKTDELLDSYGHAYRVPAAEATAPGILVLFDSLEADREAVRLALRRDSDTMRETAFRTLERFFSHGLEEAARRRDQ